MTFYIVSSNVVIPENNSWFSKQVKKTTLNFITGAALGALGAGFGTMLEGQLTKTETLRKSVSQADAEMNQALEAFCKAEGPKSVSCEAALEAYLSSEKTGQPKTFTECLYPEKLTQAQLDALEKIHQLATKHLQTGLNYFLSTITTTLTRGVMLGAAVNSLSFTMGVATCLSTSSLAYRVIVGGIAGGIINGFIKPAISDRA